MNKKKLLALILLTTGTLFIISLVYNYIPKEKILEHGAVAVTGAILSTLFSIVITGMTIFIVIIKPTLSWLSDKPVND